MEKLEKNIICIGSMLYSKMFVTGNYIDKNIDVDQFPIQSLILCDNNNNIPFDRVCLVFTVGLNNSSYKIQIAHTITGNDRSIRAKTASVWSAWKPF